VFKQKYPAEVDRQGISWIVDVQLHNIPVSSALHGYTRENRPGNNESRHNEELFTGLPPGVVRTKGLSRVILGGKGRPELQRMRNQF
jgi:hypothetical protein